MNVLFNLFIFSLWFALHGLIIVLHPLEVFTMMCLGGAVGVAVGWSYQFAQMSVWKMMLCFWVNFFITRALVVFLMG